MITESYTLRNGSEEVTIEFDDDSVGDVRISVLTAEREHIGAIEVEIQEFENGATIGRSHYLRHEEEEILEKEYEY